MVRVVTFAVILLWVGGRGEGSDVTQTPSIHCPHVGDSVQMNCSHQKGANYYQMYWYHQRPGENIQLIVFTAVGVAPDFEKLNNDNYEVVKTQAESGSFKVKNVKPDDSGLVLSKQVHQSPSAQLKNPGDSVEFNCSHGIPSYDTILWYQQKEDNRTLKLIGNIQYTNDNIEDPYKKSFKITGDGEKAASLQMSKVQAEDTAVYFCAAS